MIRRRTRDARRGSALLAVLWLSIVMTAIAFALSRSVRAELDQAALQVDGTKAYFLALGGIERARMVLATARGPRADAISAWTPGQRHMRFAFPSGDVDVEVIGENGKLNLNQIRPEVLERLLVACGVEPGRAVAQAARIVALRAGPGPQGPLAVGDGNSPDGSSFLGRRTSFQELEELLLVPGVTPELLYGSFREDERREGQIVAFGGLYRHLTLYGSGTVSANDATPEVLQAAGVPAGRIETLLAIRTQRPLSPDDQALVAVPEAESGIRLGVSGSSQAYTLAATARLKGKSAVRTLGALVQMAPAQTGLPVRVVRWYDAGF